MVEISGGAANKLTIFPRGQVIWVMSGSTRAVEEIEDGLNREVMVVHRLSDFTEQLEALAKRSKMTGKKEVASLIYLENSGEEIAKDFKAISSMIRISEKNGFLKVYEIGTRAEEGKTLLSNAKRYPDIMTFLRKVREDRMNEEVGVFKESAEDGSLDKDTSVKVLQIYENYEKLKLRNATLEERANQYDEDMTNKDMEIERLQFRIKEEIEPTIVKLEKELSEAQEDYTMVQRQVDSHKKLYQDKKIKVDELEEKVAELDITKEALYKELKELQQDKKAVEEELESLKELHAKDSESMRRVIESRVDSEAYQEIQEALENKNKEIEALKAESYKKDVRTKQLEARLDLKDDELEGLKKEGGIFKSGGISTNVEKGTLERTPLIYVKVIDELAFHRKALRMLFDKLEIIYGATGGYKKGYLVLLRNEEGKKDVHFSDVAMYSKVGDVRDTVFRLLPSSMMWTDIDEFEKKASFVMVVDYIRTTEYYLDSYADKVFYNLLEASSKISEYGLKGLPISLDTENSVFDIFPEKQLMMLTSNQYKDKVLEEKLMPLMGRTLKELHFE